MEQPNLQNLKYGIIYIFSDPVQSDHLHRSADLLQKIVFPMDIEWVDEYGRDGAVLVARRFNVGNIGQYATVSLRTSRHNRGGGQLKALHEFTDVLMNVSDPEAGDIVLDEDDFSSIRFHADYGAADPCCYSLEEEMPQPCAAPQDKTRVEKEGRLRFKFNEHLRGILKKGAKNYTERHVDEIILPNLVEPDEDQLQEEEDLELAKLERDRKEALERIRRDIVNYIARYHDDPKVLMAELLRGKVVVGHPGRLLVNGDMKIVLPEYDELEIEMPAMCRTLYILFMKQRKQGCGIVLRNIDEFRDEMIDIYGLVKPGANERRVERSINNLCDPYGESLNQTISRINRCVKNVIIDKDLAKDYLILGNRGEAYSIGLDPEYLELPRAVTGA